jgi:hypothetical protein
MRCWTVPSDGQAATVDPTRPLASTMMVMVLGWIIGGVIACALVAALVLLGWWPFLPASAPSVLVAFTLGAIGAVGGMVVATERWG